MHFQNFGRLFSAFFAYPAPATLKAQICMDVPYGTALPIPAALFMRPLLFPPGNFTLRGSELPRRCIG